MACLLPRVAAASLPVVVLITTASTSPAAAQTFPASERPTRSGYVNPPSSATSPSSAPTSSATQPASPATPTPFFSRTRAHISLRRKQLQPTPGTSASASSSSTTRSAWSSARPGPTTTFPKTNAHRLEVVHGGARHVFPRASSVPHLQELTRQVHPVAYYCINKGTTAIQAPTLCKQQICYVILSPSM
jgi:hypothetical protein